MVQATAHQREFQRAIDAYANGDYTLSIDILSAVVQTNPNDYNARLWLASAQQQIGQYQDAYINYQLVLQGTTDPEMTEWARSSLETMSDVVPAQVAGAADAAPSDLSFDFADIPSPPETNSADFFNPEVTPGQQSAPPAAAVGANDDLFDDLFGAADDKGSGGANAFDDLFDTGLEMLNEMDQTVIDPNVGNFPVQSGGGSVPGAQFQTTPIDDMLSPKPGHFDVLDAFADAGDDFGDDNVTQIASDDSFQTFHPGPSSDPPPTQFMPMGLDPISLDPLSEPIPAPESDSSSTDIGPTLLDIDELDSVDQELAGLEAGEQLDDFGFVTQDLSSLPIPTPAAPPPRPEPPAAKPSTPPPRATKKTTRSSGEAAWLANRPAAGKQLVLTLVQGATTLIIGGAAYGLLGATLPNQNSRALASVAGGALAGSLVGWLLGGMVTKQASSISEELMEHFNAINQGNYGVRAMVRSNDEWGRLANSFNQMVQNVEVNVSELQKQVVEQGEAKEDLHRQVIRLLDDVEGAARGDLTVRAEVTANVLGAVADSFNLTIRSLRDIVSQVKRAASSVSDAAYQNEEFARSLSADALRQAEEIASSLNSVQTMTESIQQVASNAREAAEVGRRATDAARRGGEAVDLTVTGILEIRETVAETTRQVKRLAESSQEINKIVALISTIASRTNLLALNASIEAARAGEAGRGFSIVADEVRQLADRAAKSSKEIEQLVLQIQSETKTVMTAMENGTQQVIEGTRRAEQAKSSLDEIIEVSRTIDSLVRSISEATVQQTDTSRSVSQVMQTVQLTANETAGEAQKVAGSLMQLVTIARELQASVGRFRVGDE
ncbi:MAG: hypothetical protein OHK0012_18060 [Synechococcales cyanobacterium]